MSALSDLQAWLVGKGASIAVDGKPGPKTRASVIETFRNPNAPAVTSDEMTALASSLGCTVKQIVTVGRVESAGGGWDDTGLLKCLWERHWLWKRVRFAIPLLSDPKPGGYTVDADRDGLNDSWEKLADASLRYGALAFECASFGKFQIMGGHWKALGYPSVLEFVWQMSRTEAAHYRALAAFVRVNGLLPALRAIDGNAENCRAFAKGYNGPAYERFDYHRKLAAAWKTA